MEFLKIESVMRTESMRPLMCSTRNGGVIIRKERGDIRSVFIRVSGAVRKREEMLGAYGIKRVAAGAHLPTPLIFEPAKRPDDIEPT